ncbi:hypothetical protein GCM10009817_23480 [Terrabacter lapilli]|uniref:Uncharacterized protein n=1 Tax=Terrabacter lapilli TaxID=436231 RepID=A0ABN2S773_9MICO
MSTRTVSLTPQEALARDLIVERVATRHHAPKAQGSRRHSRRHTRAALLLRRLAERLDPSVVRDARDAREGRGAGGAAGAVAGAVAGATPGRLGGAPHAGRPRPWSAAPRPAQHRRS